jgi:outer membrane immunogenic protein
MRKLIFAAMFLGSVAAAQAADLAAKSPYAPPAPNPPAPNWTGMYIGGFIGGTWADETINTVGLAPSGVKASSFMGGAYIGYDNEFADKFIFGGRVLVPFFSLSQTGPVSGIAGTTESTKADWATTIDLTLGYDLGQWEPYAGAGVMFVNNKATAATAAGATSDSELQTGLDILVGAKYRFAANWAVGLEYNYDIIANQTYAFGPPIGTTAQGKADASSLLGMVEYRF